MTKTKQQKTKGFTPEQRCLRISTSFWNCGNVKPRSVGMDWKQNGWVGLTNVFKTNSSKNSKTYQNMAQ